MVGLAGENANGDAEMVVTYAYDAWGNTLGVSGSLAGSIGQVNPFRYRSYFYDRETGLYCLQSRYYNPATGRWINSDDVLGVNEDALSYNLFIYCGNNPVIREDPSGHFAITALIVAAIITLIVVKVVIIAKEENRVRKVLTNLPKPKSDVSKSFSTTLKSNANVIEKTKEDKGIITAGLLFYNNVRNHGIWDYKQLPEYKDTFSFNGMIVQGEDLGNINFGYTGAALGLPAMVLLTGAGYAQIKAGTSNLSCIIASNGDDLRDQIFIMYGIMLYYDDQKKGLI